MTQNCLCISVQGQEYLQNPQVQHQTTKVVKLVDVSSNCLCKQLIFIELLTSDGVHKLFLSKLVQIIIILSILLCEQGPPDAIAAESSIVGVGMTPESVEQNPVMYELMSEMAFRSDIGLSW